MKKNSMIAALMLLFAIPCLAEHVRPDVAQKAAKTFLSAKLVEQPQISLIDFADRASFPNLYFYGNDRCFVIIAADDRVQPVLGYSLTSSFGTESLPDNVRCWLQGYNDEIQYAIENQMRATTETSRLWEDLIAGNTNAAMSTLVVAPLIQTKWNQNAYYNDLCPEAEGGPNGRAYTGCTATAMAQIMKFYDYPPRGMGSHSYDWNGQTLSADFEATTYDWDNMNPYYEYYYDDEGTFHWLPTPSPEEVTAVATLMYHCGVSVNMNYSGSGSGASLMNAANALKTYFNYSADVEYKTKSSYGDAEWKTMMKNELNAGRPIQYAGYNPSGSGGHAFVCDGYDNTDYFHFNWGWAGHYNGYFSLSNLDTGANSSDPGAGNGVYTRDQEAIFGIRPSSNNATPTNLTYTQNGCNITLNWTGASGASSYNIYRNSTCIDNTASNSYTETAPYGTNVYYVRSVDSNGELSLPTNSVTVTVIYPTPIVDDLSATVSENNVSLSWSVPEWCYPETPSATLTYGDGNYNGYSFGYNNGTTTLYWGHRYPAANLSNYNNMAIYKVSFLANETGPYQLFVYQGTSSDHPQTQILQYSFDVLSTGWYDIDLPSNIQVNTSQDLWVFIYDPEARNFPATYCSYSGSDGNYYSTNPTSWTYTWSNAAYLIQTYLTDGTYTYNIYRNGASIASNVDNTTYNDNNLADGAYTYYVKTNYYGGETDASNSVSVQVGDIVYYTITALANPTEGGMVSGSGTYENGASVTLTATANTGYTFTNWTKDGQQVSTSESYTFTVTEDASYVANFTLNTYQITATASPSDGGMVSGGGSYNHGSNCTLMATANEDYGFVNWTMDGEVVSSDATYSFTVVGNADFVANFESMIITQTSNLNEGWNWWSCYVDLDGIDGLEQMEESLGDNGVMIKSRKNGFDANYGSFWVGSLDNVNNESTYLILTNADCEMTVTGVATTPTAHPITLPLGWSWIGYPCTAPMSVIEALSGLNPMEDDLVKSRESFAIYTPGIGWLGTLETIMPGMGLMFESHNTETVTLIYPEAARSEGLKENVTARGNHWEPAMQGYAQNMSVMATVELDGEELEGERYELAAFSNGECRGSARLMYVEPIDKYMAFLTVYGDGAEELGFGLYDALTDQETFETNETLVFEANAVVGAVDAPFVVRFGGMTGMDEFGGHIHLFPNPVERGQMVSFGMADTEIGTVQVEIINVFGVVEAQYMASLQAPIVIKAPNTPGVYTLRIVYEGKENCFRRLIVR